MSLTERVAKFLRANRRKWVDGRALAKVGGFAGWRTRISECRRFYRMQIENEVIRHKSHTSTRYRYVRKVEA